MLIPERAFVALITWSASFLLRALASNSSTEIGQKGMALLGEWFSLKDFVTHGSIHIAFEPAW